MGSYVRIANVLALLVSLPAIAFAQASITGTVRDTSGAILPGVTVEAASPALIERVRSTVTDSDGLYRIVDLRPGTYTVTATLPGFATVIRGQIELLGSATVTIPLDMKVGDLQETVTVTGETPVIDVQNTRRESVLDDELVRALPATRAYGSLLNATPGLTVDNNGLAATPTMTFFSAHGGNNNEGRVQINGMTVAAAFNGGGVSSLTYDTSNVQEVSMLVSGGLGESETGGPVMNIVPRSGGNAFSGQAFLNTAGDWSRGDNIDDALRAAGISRGPGVISSYDASGAYGGPIVHDRLWFYGSYRKFETAAGVEGIGINRYAGDATHWDYSRDNNIEPRNVQGRDIWSVRLTGQLNSKNRLTFSHEHQLRCEGSTLTSAGGGCRTRSTEWIALGSTTQSPESNTGYYKFPYDVTQVTWTETVSSRLLFEAGYSRFAYRHANGPGQLPPDGIFDLIPVTEQAARDGHPAGFTYRGLFNYEDDYGNPNHWRGSATYVTGAHSMKVGYQGSYLVADRQRVGNDSLLQYRFNNLIPNAVSYQLPTWESADRTRVTAFYAQDTWTRSRLTVQGALRYDHASSFSPAEHNGTGQTSRFNQTAISFDRTDGASYHDLSPRVGLAYDVFGNGKTAVKFNLGRYLAPATNDTGYVVNNPATFGNPRVVNTVTNRGWNDVNGNFAVDCDLLNVAQNGECAAASGAAVNFGKASTPTAATNPDVITGWGTRPYDWQWGLNLSQQIIPRVSLDVGYNRRWWGNYTVVDNTLVGPADYETWTITAPQDSRLPGGGGYPVDVYTLTAAASARGAFNYTTFETDFGPARDRHWQGVDVTLTARLAGLTLSGGTSTGQLFEDTCGTVLKIDSPDPRFCHNVEPYRTDIRGNAAYTIPKIDVLVSGTVRSQAPAQIVGLAGTNVGSANAATPSGANWQVPNSVVQGILGRLPPGGAVTGNTLVALTDQDAHRLYVDNRRTQLDMRFAKILRFGRTRADVGIDLNNLLNTNYALTYSNTYAYNSTNSWLNPLTILSPRFARVNFTLTF